jgi:hypothetical protein
MSVKHQPVSKRVSFAIVNDRPENRGVPVLQKLATKWVR